GFRRKTRLVAIQPSPKQSLWVAASAQHFLWVAASQAAENSFTNQKRPFCVMQNNYPRFISRPTATVRILFFAHLTKLTFPAASSAKQSLCVAVSAATL